MDRSVNRLLLNFKLTSHRLKLMKIKFSCLCSHSFSFFLLLHMYKTETCSLSVQLFTHPPALFGSTLMMFKAQKRFLSDFIIFYCMLPNDLIGPMGDMLNGGALLHLIQWPTDHPDI